SSGTLRHAGLLSVLLVPVRVSCGVSHHFFFDDPPTTEIYTLSLHDALPISIFQTGTDTEVICHLVAKSREEGLCARLLDVLSQRSEEHTSELQSRENLVCRLLLEKKKQ